MILSDDKQTLIRVEDKDIAADGTFKVPQGVNVIAKEAFYNCTALKQIDIPGSVSSIECLAFSGCINLEEVRIPAGVKSISEGLFAHCSNLKQVTIPDSVTSIEEHVFYNCIALKQIDIPCSVTSIKNYAFGGCANLKQITIPGSVISIKDYVFFNCINLEEIHIGEGVSSLSAGLFAHCVNLKQVTLPDSVTSIEGFAFFGCENLEQVRMHEGVKSIGDRAFSSCKSLQTIAINSSDEKQKERILQLLPEYKSKVVFYSEEPYQEIVRKELNRLTNTVEINFLAWYVSKGTEQFNWAIPELLAYITQFEGISNPYYKKASFLIKQVPLPLLHKGEEGFRGYQKSIEDIVALLSEKAIDFKSLIRPKALPEEEKSTVVPLSIFSSSDSKPKEDSVSDVFATTHSLLGG